MSKATACPMTDDCSVTKMTDSTDHPVDPQAHDAAKRECRVQMKATLAAMTPDERRRASSAACSRLVNLDVFRHASVVMLYMPLASEVDTAPVAIRCFQALKTVCVPRVDWKRKVMHAIEVTSFDDHFMEIDEHGLRTPRDGQPIPPSAVDLVIVPGLAFDTTGNRLGRGGGYYDRFLSRLRRAAVSVGFAFDAQITEGLPVNELDVSVDLVVTDRRVTRSRTPRKL